MLIISVNDGCHYCQDLFFQLIFNILTEVSKSSFTVLLLIGNTYLLLINRGSQNRWWISKSFIDATYNDSC
jgi:hypothetical protein